jgi:hypothetical protein
MVRLGLPFSFGCTEHETRLFQSNQHYRIEKDTFGELQVPADRYWGAQTQRYE